MNGVKLTIQSQLSGLFGCGMGVAKMIGFLECMRHGLDSIIARHMNTMYLLKS